MGLPTHRPPSREGVEDGLAWAAWLPVDDPPWPGIVIVHGAGSRKENHADFARLASASGWAALTFDSPGHGASEGEVSPRILDQVIAMFRLLGSLEGVDADRIAVRGSSLGGFLAIHAASRSSAVHGVIAICPASEDDLRRGMRRGELEMRISDPSQLQAWLADQDLREAVEMLGRRPLILLHAKGDESIPYTWSQELYEHARGPRRLILVPGGDHRSVQHDPELQATTLRWLERALAGAVPL